MMGGGTPNFLPKSAPGSKRVDEEDYIKKFEDAGYAFVTTKTELNAPRGNRTKLLGLFNPATSTARSTASSSRRAPSRSFPISPT